MSINKYLKKGKHGFLLLKESMFFNWKLLYAKPKKSFSITKANFFNHTANQF